MPQERTLVSFDWAIKNLLRNKADYVILEGFLTTLLGKKIKIKSLPDSKSNKDSEDAKYNRVDVLAEEEDGTMIMIEIQFTEEIDYFHRMLFGSCKTIVDYFSKGMPYSKVRKVYSINVVYFDLGAGEDYIYHGSTTFKGLHRKDELELTPEQRNEFAKLEIKDIYPEFYILKVDRFRDIVKNKLDEWMYFLKNSSIKSDFVAPGLLEANEKLEYSRLSLSERRAYDKYVDTIRSNNSSLYTAKLKGKLEGEALGFEKGEALGEARGIEKGKAEGILQVAKKMIEQGINTDVILKVTGLSKEDMVKLTGKEPITMETLLTQNFKVKEFLTGPNPPKWDDLSERVQGQIKELANMLQTIRDAVKKPISISSGLRTLEDYNRMVKNKLNPSKKSDHFFGQTVDGYSLGLGAVDITCKGMDTIAFYNLILKMKYEGKIKCGQLLLEKNKTFWVHIANHWGNWLKEKERESRSLNDNGYSLNNGKSFTWLLSGEFAPSDLGNSK